MIGLVNVIDTRFQLFEIEHLVTSTDFNGNYVTSLFRQIKKYVAVLVGLRFVESGKNGRCGK